MYLGIQKWYAYVANKLFATHHRARKLSKTKKLYLGIKHVWKILPYAKSL